NLFTTLGTQPRLGRGFRPDEEVPGNHRVLVISHRYWQSRFGGDASVVGRSVRVDGEPYQIVGVLPADFSGWRQLSWVDVFRRLALDAEEARERTPTGILLLALGGGLCALLVAQWTFDWFAVASAGDNGVGVDFHFDWHVLGWASLACLFTAVTFGVAPALFVQRLDLNTTLKSGGRGATG